MSKYNCSLCNKKYSCRQNLYKHKKTIHLSNESEEKQYKSIEGLQQPQKNHNFTQKNTIIPQFSTKFTQNSTIFSEENNLNELINNMSINNDMDYTNNNNRELISSDNLTSDKDNIFECEYCLKILSRQDSLKRHYKICKKKNDYDLRKENKRESKELKEEVYNLKQQLLELMNKNCKVHHKTFQKMQNQLNNNGTINNTINNNQLNINIVPLGLEEVAASLTDAEQQEVISKKASSILHLIKMVHFNDNLPQFKNVVITNCRNNIGYMYDKDIKKFIAIDKTELISNMLEYRADDIYDLIECQKDKMSEAITSYTSNYINELLDNERLKEEYLKKINYLVYNNTNQIDIKQLMN